MAISLRNVGHFVGAGFAAQAVAALAGLLLVRWMSVADYAIYTIGITIVGAIRLLTRGGVQLGLAAALARVWPDRAGAAGAVRAAVQVRLLVSALTMPPILALSWFLLDRAGASGTQLLVLCGILALIWLADFEGCVIDSVLFFDGKAVRVQLLDAVIAGGRLALIGAVRLGGMISASAALLTNLFAVAARIPQIRKWVAATLAPHARRPAPAAEVAEIRTIALRQIPVDLFVALQAQAAIFFLTQSGGGIELATFGALSRIAAILTPFSAVILAYFVPAFASATDRVGGRILRYVAIGALPGIGLAIAATVAPGALLYFIGPAYAGQAWPLMVCAWMVAATSAVEVAASLVAHRGWNRWGWLRIVIGLVWIGIAPRFFAVETAAGAYVFVGGFSVGTLLALWFELQSAQRKGEIHVIREARN